MAKVYAFFADGMEEIEAIAPVDLLRRAGNEVVTVSVMGKNMVHGSHGIDLMADCLLEDIDGEDADLLFLPGGGVGTQNLEKNDRLAKLLDRAARQGKHLAAICAAPSILGHMGLLMSRQAVIYPGMEDHLAGSEVLEIPTVTDQGVTTGRGAGAAIDLGLELIRVLNGEAAAEAMRDQIVYPHGAGK